MIHSNKFIVVLDACVLYPAPLRDLLLSLASKGLYKLKWSNIIQEEWSENLLNKRTDLKREQIKKTINAMNLAFPDAMTEGFEDLIPALNLPDKDDRHVLACAIRCNSKLIVTSNIKDFPSIELSKYDIEARTPDKFVADLIELDPELSCLALDELIARLRNPAKTREEVFSSLSKNGLSECIDKFDKLC